MNRIQPPDSAHEMGDNKCPHCGLVNDRASGLGGNERAPDPGDLSVCIGCGQPSVFDENLRSRRMTPEEAKALPPDALKAICAVQAAIAVNSPSVRSGYEAQCNRMLAAAKQWRAANPDKQAAVQFNFPAGVAIIAPITEAIRKHLVTCNEAGRELLEVLKGGGDPVHEPTVLMVRAVLEHE